MRPFAEAEEYALIAARSEMLRFPRSLAGNLRITLASLMADPRPMATAVDLQRDTFPAVWLVLSRPDFVQTLNCRPPVVNSTMTPMMLVGDSLLESTLCTEIDTKSPTFGAQPPALSNALFATLPAWCTLFSWAVSRSSLRLGEHALEELGLFRVAFRVACGVACVVSGMLAGGAASSKDTVELAIQPGHLLLMPRSNRTRTAHAPDT